MTFDRAARSLVPGILLVFAALAGGDDDGENIDIGTHGASIAFGPEWKRATISKDLGPDQYHFQKRSLLKTQQAFLIIYETETRLESRADLERLLKERIDQMKLSGEVKSGEIDAVEGAELMRARVDLDVKISGVQLAYRLELLSKDGLSYLLMGWGPKSDAAAIRAAMSRVADRLRFPPGDSEWGKLLEPVTRRLFLDDRELSFSVRPAIFLMDAENDEGGLAHLPSRDQESAISIYASKGDETADAVLDEFHDLRRAEEPTTREVSRRDVHVSGVAGREAVYEDKTYCIVQWAIPYEAGSFLDLRYAALGPAGSTRVDRALFFESLRLTPPEGFEGLPAMESTEVTPPPDEHIERLLAESRLLGETRLHGISHAHLEPERLMVSDMRSIRELSLGDGSSRELWRREEWRPSLSFSPWKGRIAFADTSGRLGFVGPEGKEATATEAAMVTWAGSERIVVLRRRPLPSVPGLGSLSWSPPDRLVVLEGSEPTERVLSDIDAPVELLSANGVASALLVATSRREDLERSPTSIRIVPLESGEAHQFLHGWRAVSRIGPAGEGWVVTGRREGQPGGVYLLSRNGTPEILVSGPEVEGVALEDDEMTFLSSARVGGGRPVRSSSSLLAYRAPVRAAREHGRLSLPFPAALLSRIGKEVLGDAPEGWPFGSADEVQTCARKAVDLSGKIAGRPLPVHGAALDRVIAEAGLARDELSAAGEALLGILLAAGFLEKGAVWVPSVSVESGGLWQPRIEELAGNDMAMGYSPADVIASVLHDEEAWWEPAVGIAEELRGRKLYLGLDRVTLEKAMAAEPILDLAGLARAGDATAIEAALAAAPSNEHLREQAYLHLAAADRLDIMTAIAGDYAKREGAVVVDRKAWFHARSAAVKGPEEASALEKDLLQAIEREPGEPSFYYFLALANDRDGGNKKRARACYKRVLKLIEFGPLADSARAKLQGGHRPPGEGE